MQQGALVVDFCQRILWKSNITHPAKNKSMLLVVLTIGQIHFCFAPSLRKKKWQYGMQLDPFARESSSL
jgi:hypothetical protein